MRIYISGQKQFGADAYRLVKRLGHEIVGVSAPALSVSGAADRLRGLAELDGVPWLEAGALRSDRLPGGTDLIRARHTVELREQMERVCVPDGVDK
jgi:methionyl-tRNA formyltransferase